MKRDILIFPKFNNIEQIQKIRMKYDKLANILPPHITIIFPFTDKIDDSSLSLKLSEILKRFGKFKVKFKGVSLSDDNYIFLNCIEGKEEIISLHDAIYNEILPSHLNTKIKYIPHITMGNAKDLKDFKDFKFEFTATIDELILEGIGKNEESIILNKFKLG